MEPLLGKLTNLMGDEFTNVSVVRQRVSFLQHELCAMNAVIDKMERLDELDPSAKDWMGQVREMAYDIDDCIGDFTAQIGDTNAEQAFVQKVTRYLRTLWARREIAVQIEELKSRAIEVSERHLRYMVYADKGSSSIHVSDGTHLAIDPRVLSLYQEAACLVGIDAQSQRAELVNWLLNNEDKLKVVSIVGVGGVGKTAIAKLVYDEVGEKFDCKVFLSVSQKPDLVKLLSGIYIQLGIEKNSCSCEINVLIDGIKKHLASQRYIILIDDLWDLPAWDIIRCAFPENNNRSRVILTTRLNDVAVWAHNICRMQPLNSKEARILFFNRVFGSQYDCTSHFELEEVSTEILNKCGGLPLAITAVASILAACPARLSDWMSINNSMSLQFGTNPSFKGMKHVLNLSYKHLPRHLRPCFLYLGLYPEDCEVARDVLIHEWISEGLVSAAHLGQPGLEDVAKRYFNELVNRNLLLPVRTKHGEVLSCKVHHMMLDLILSKCAEDDFISVARSSADMERLHHYKVRRLSLRLSDAGIPGAISESLSHVRSLAWFRTSPYAPNLLLFKYLRVLIIDTGKGNTTDLTAIGALFQLRYLRVSTSDACVELPSKIRGLVNLETFYIHRDKASEISQKIPSDIFLLPCLLHLMVPHGAKLPKGIGNMIALHTLCGFQFSLKDIMSLANLTNLRRLKLHHIVNFDIGTTGVDALVSSLEKLLNLKYLAVDGRIDKNKALWIKDENNRLCSLSSPPTHIEVLKLEYWMVHRIPKWIGGLMCLRRLTLHVKMLLAEDVCLLGRLPSLVKLHLFVVDIPTDRTVKVAAGLFPVLQILKIDNEHGNAMTFLHFEAGAMPKLQQLFLLLPRGGWRGTTPVGMEHLLSLKGMYAIWNHYSDEGLDEVRAAFSKAIELHPGHPSFTVFYCHLGSNAYLYAYR